MFSFRRSIADIISQISSVPAELSAFATSAEAKAAKDRANASFYNVRGKGHARDARAAREMSRILSKVFKSTERKPRKRNGQKADRSHLSVVK